MNLDFNLLVTRQTDPAEGQWQSLDRFGEPLQADLNWRSLLVRRRFWLEREALSQRLKVPRSQYASSIAPTCVDNLEAVDAKYSPLFPGRDTSESPWVGEHMSKIRHLQLLCHLPRLVCDPPLSTALPTPQSCLHSKSVGEMARIRQPGRRSTQSVSQPLFVSLGERRPSGPRTEQKRFDSLPMFGPTMSRQLLRKKSQTTHRARRPYMISSLSARRRGLGGGNQSQLIDSEA
ncbi:hypothetical protein B0T26DRAFT_276691 [Lasiosphaeria miniovina]|uniref:Uncharacterized protein n=1 Tax=Lasiosphaeria miniovina TaxID=1954250 RepID=A0AA40DXV2_9PEZI|nr:uncharacterized protein B0T26DRAFT_276691 [Lasiosphaeria miniovina]KAK0717036.1 hypothetical protein B0T26DRAFT_276691 [Lasiosphaeria miniovina]